MYMSDKTIRVSEEVWRKLRDRKRCNALEKLGQANGGAAQDVGEGVQDLQERVDELKQERDRLQDELDRQAEAYEDMAAQRDRAQERVADLEAEVQELRTAFEGAADEIASLAENFEVDVDLSTPTVEGQADADVQTLRERIDELESRNERLQAQADVEVSETLETYEDFLGVNAVQGEIDAAKKEGSASPRYVKGVIAAIVSEGGPVTYDAIAERLGVSTTSDVSTVASELERRKIVSKDASGSEIHVDLNTHGIEEVRKAAAERERTEALMDEL